MIAFMSPTAPQDCDCSGTATCSNNTHSPTAIFYIVDEYDINHRSFPISRPLQYNTEEYYKKYPHRVPNVYIEAPLKLQYKSNTPLMINKTIKQPDSKSGFKRGQRV